MNLQKILYKYFNRKKYDALQFLMKSQWFSSGKLIKLQNDKFMKLINHVEKSVPYYAHLLEDITIKSIKDIYKIPFLDKEIINKYNDELTAKIKNKKRFKKNSTSGSTGNKIEFYSDNCDYIGIQALMRSDQWAGKKLGDKKAVLWGAHRDINKLNNFYGKLKKWIIHKSIILNSFNLSEKNMHKYYQKIVTFRPKILIGYASALYIFSEFLKNNNLSVDCIKGIVSGAETLYEEHRSIIEQTFGCKVYDRYGCREVGQIASECNQQDGLHISTEHVYVEIINEEGERCKPGELGEIVVTDLGNYVFPFIRYKIGDIGIMSDRDCKCGRKLPMLEKVEGRVFDVIVGTNGTKVTGTFWTIKFREDIKGIDKFQVIQEQDKSLKIKLVVNSKYNKNEENKIIKLVENKLGNNMIINIEKINNISKTGSGKHRWIISKVSPFDK